MSADPNEVARLFPLEPAWPDSEVHDPYADKWQKHSGGDRRDPAADREVRDAIKREQRGEYDGDGVFQPSGWEPA